MKLFFSTIFAAIMIMAIIFTGPMPAFEAGAESASATEYYIQVDITNQHVTVFRKSDMVIVRQMICSTGTNATPTAKSESSRHGRSAPRTSPVPAGTTCERSQLMMMEQA